MVYKFGITTSEDKVINIKYKDNKLTIDSFGIDQRSIHQYLYVVKIRRLFHANFFMQVSMQEGRLNIHLMDFPFIGCSKGKNKVN